MNNKGKPATRWGPALFWLVLTVLLMTFWWVLSYSGGAPSHHG